MKCRFDLNNTMNKCMSIWGEKEKRNEKKRSAKCREAIQ